jgi:DNA polymerase III epsilon subunit-like protein
VGHNVHFDLIFVKEAYRLEKLVPPDFRYTVDTVSLAWPLVHQGVLPKLSLESICAQYHIPNDGQHTAMADVKRTIRAFAKLLGMREPRWK